MKIMLVFPIIFKTWGSLRFWKVVPRGLFWHDSLGISYPWLITYKRNGVHVLGRDYFWDPDTFPVRNLLSVGGLLSPPFCWLLNVIIVVLLQHDFVWVRDWTRWRLSQTWIFPMVSTLDGEANPVWDTRHSNVDWHLPKLLYEYSWRWRNK